MLNTHLFNKTALQQAFIDQDKNGERKEGRKEK